MRQIELHSRKYPGLFALVDDEDFELASQYRWFPSKSRRTFYAQTHIRVEGKRITLLMHRLIMGFPDSEVDHENRNGLDCCKVNLRIATDSQNAANKTKRRGTYSSVYKGVTWHHGKWMAQVKVQGKCKFLGYFTDEVEAARTYDRAAVEEFGPFACLNFAESQPVVVNVFVQPTLPIAA